MIRLNEPNWLKWSKQLQAIAQAGLEYSKDAFDLERFQQIRELSIDIMHNHTGTSKESLKGLFANESGYQTPKVDVRAVVFKENKILLVREIVDGKWTLPGGWADTGISASENVIKETSEETGYVVEPIRLLAVLDKDKHPHPTSPYHIYKMFFLCELIGGAARNSIETNGVGFFERHSIPPLSIGRTTENQIELAFQYLDDPDKATYFD